MPIANQYILISKLRPRKIILPVILGLGMVVFLKINDHLLIFTRQLVMWIMMIVRPTPGGSGFAELILGRYLSDLIPVDQATAGGAALNGSYLENHKLLSIPFSWCLNHTVMDRTKICEGNY